MPDAPQVFPLKIRSAAVSLGMMVNFGAHFLVVMVFDLVRQRLGEAVLFGDFALVALAALAFIGALVPETKGMTLEEIEAQMRGECDDAEPDEGSGGLYPVPQRPNADALLDLWPEFTYQTVGECKFG